MKMLLKTFNIGLITPFVGPFQDVTTTEWYSQYVNTAKLYTLLEETKTYWPSAEITRGQISENIYRTMITKDFGYEKKLYTNAMLEAVCYYISKGTVSDAMLTVKSNTIFKKFGFDTTTDPETISKLYDKYSKDTEVQNQINERIKSCNL